MKLSSLIIVLVVIGVAFGGMVWWFGFSRDDLARISFYLDLANPAVKVVRVTEGMRKEEIADAVGDKLGWSTEERTQFINAHLAMSAGDLEGKYFPKTYLLDKDETPEAVSSAMVDEFEKQSSKVIKKKSEVLKEETIITIASIIQREAAGKNDMRLISGIIWNRIWSGMKLQMDATLQYAKGSEEEGWWPRVVPEDKKIESDYNTYLYKGLPPGAIANPGLNALQAAYNPATTKCLFYIHDKRRRIHCAETYEEHKKNIEKYL